MMQVEAGPAQKADGLGKLFPSQAQRCISCIEILRVLEMAGDWLRHYFMLPTHLRYSLIQQFDATE